MINKVTGVIYPITNYTVLQTFPNIISFGNNMSQYPTGEYYFRVVHNGVESLPNQISTLKVVSALMLQPLPALTWDSFEVNPEGKVNPVMLNINGLSLKTSPYTVLADAYMGSYKTNQAVATLAEIDAGGVALVFDLTYSYPIFYGNARGSVIPIALCALGAANNASIIGDIRINVQPNLIRYTPSGRSYPYPNTGSINDKVWVIIKNRTTVLVYFQNKGFASLETVFITEDLALKIINPTGTIAEWGFALTDMSLSFDKKILLN